MAESARNIPDSVHVIRMQFYVQLNTPSSASTFHAVGAFIDAAASTLRCYLFYFNQMMFISSFNQGIAFIIPLLVTFLQLKYQQGNDQNKSSTPFATHPTTMLVAVSSSVVYWLAYIAHLRFSLRRFDFVVHHCLVWSGYASVASLATLLYPDSISSFVYAIFALPPASELLYWLYQKLLLVAEEDGAEFHVRRRRVRRFLNNVFRVLASSSGQRRQLLPLTELRGD